MGSSALIVPRRLARSAPRARGQKLLLGGGRRNRRLGRGGGRIRGRFGGRRSGARARSGVRLIVQLDDLGSNVGGRIGPQNRRLLVADVQDNRVAVLRGVLDDHVH